MAVTLNGTYKTTRDGGLEYSYDASVAKYGDKVVWNAKVKHKGVYAGATAGTVRIKEGIDLAKHVRMQIEASLEAGVGLRNRDA